MAKNKSNQKSRSNKLDFQLTPTLQRDVVSRRGNGESVAVMKLANDEYFFSIDGIAAEIFRSIDGRTNLESIRAAMLEKYQPPIQKFEKGFVGLIAQLLKEGLIQLT